MGKRTVVVMPGDGIGRVVIPEAIRVLDAAGFDAHYVEAEIGWSCFTRDGDPLPARTKELLAAHGLGLLGAVTSKPKAESEAELPAGLRGRGIEYRSPLLTLRQHFDLSVCLRPARSFPGNPLNHVRRAACGDVSEPPIDIAVFRQNTEGLYAGVEWTDPPRAVRDALALHPRFVPYRDVSGSDLAIGLRVVTRDACRVALDAAFRYAEAHGKTTVTLAEKPNVLRETSGLWVEAARSVKREHLGVALREMNIDTLLLELIGRPESFEVIVASNLFGDIVSDAAAGLTGGIGFACSANLGPEVAVFEPVHGSAPRHAGQEPAIVNPCAAILAGALLLDHAGEPALASRVRAAVAAVVAEGTARTYDMLGLLASPGVLDRGATTTTAMADAVVAHLPRP